MNGTSLLRENQTNLAILIRNKNDRIIRLLGCFQTEGQSAAQPLSLVIKQI